MASVAFQARGGLGGGDIPPRKPNRALGRAHTAEGTSIRAKWLDKVTFLRARGADLVGIEPSSVSLGLTVP